MNDSVTTLLLSAITILGGVIAFLYRDKAIVQKECERDKRESAKLIFALLQKLALTRSEAPPPTISTLEKPQIEEAKKLALRELDADIEQQVKAYLSSDTPPSAWKR